MEKASLAPEFVLRVMDMEMYWPMISSFLPHRVNPRNQFSDLVLHIKAFVDFQGLMALCAWNKNRKFSTRIINLFNKSLTMQSTVIPAIVSTIIWWWRAMFQMTTRATVMIAWWNIWRIATSSSVQFCWFGRI